MGIDLEKMENGNVNANGASSNEAYEKEAKERFEKVEKVRLRTGVSFEDAKYALEACDYDVLDAVVYLEKLGKVINPDFAGAAQGGSYNSSSYTSDEFERAQKSYEKDCRKSNFQEGLDDVGNTLKRVLNKAWKEKFVVVRHGEVFLDLPILVFIIILVAAFTPSVVALIVGLFLDCRYSFTGSGNAVNDVNNVCDKVSDVANDIKSGVKKDE